MLFSAFWFRRSWWKFKGQKIFTNSEIISYDFELDEYSKVYDATLKNYNIESGVIGIGDNSTRKKFVEYVYQICANFKFESLIHPKSNIGKNVIIGDGTIVMSGVSVNSWWNPTFTTTWY